MVFCPMNDTICLLSFCDIKLIFLLPLLSIINHCIPPQNCSMYLQPGSTSIVKLWVLQIHFLLKIIHWARSVSRIILSNDSISTGLNDRLDSSYIVPVLKSKKSCILSSVVNLISGSCLEIFIIDPSVEKLRLIVNR